MSKLATLDDVIAAINTGFAQVMSAIQLDTVDQQNHCITCRFFVMENPGAPLDGRCVRHAPPWEKVNSQTGFCGDHRQLIS